MINSPNSPGPCAYYPKLSDKKLTPAWTMHGSKNRDICSSNQIPGPGAYQLKTLVRFFLLQEDGPKCLIKGKSNTKIYFFDKDVPGPGKYTPKHDLVIKKIVSR